MLINDLLPVMAGTLDERIDGYTLRSLDESVLEDFGVSYGFRHVLLNIIEILVW